MGDFESLLSELDRDPEFRKAYRRQKPYYDLVLEIIRLRKEQNLTQSDLASRMGKHQSSISRIESAEHDPRLSTLVDIAEALDATLEIKMVPRIGHEEFKEILILSAAEQDPTVTYREPSDESIKLSDSTYLPNRELA